MPHSSPPHDDPHRPGSRFDTTHWSLVLTAGQARTPQSTAALAALCESYWYPLYSYARRRAVDVADAQDTTQAFFAKLLEKNYVGAADPERGRFRAFLLTAFKHFLSKERDKARAIKRGGGRMAMSLDFAAADSRYALEPPAGLTPEQLFNRQWAVTLLELVMRRLESEFTARDKGPLFQRLKGFAIGDHAGETYAQAAADLAMSEAAAKMAAHRLRQRYRELLREEIAMTVASPDEIDEEIRNLFSVFQG